MMRYSLFILIFLLLAPSFASGIRLNLTYPVPPGAPDINTEAGQTIPGIIAWFYYFIIMISGLAGFAMIVWGGIQYLTSAGNPGQMSDALDRIKSVLLGLALVLASFLILQTLNPEFTILTEPTI